MDALGEAVLLLLRAYLGWLCMKRETVVDMAEEAGESALAEVAVKELKRLGGEIAVVEGLIGVLGKE